MSDKEFNQYLKLFPKSLTASCAYLAIDLICVLVLYNVYSFADSFNKKLGLTIVMIPIWGLFIFCSIVLIFMVCAWVFIAFKMAKEIFRELFPKKKEK